MGIDFDSETPIRASRPATKIGSRSVTVVRWIINGLQVAGKKQRVKLRGVVRWVTSLQAYEEFCRATNPGGQIATLRRPRARKSAADEAGRRLEQLGI